MASHADIDTVDALVLGIDVVMAIDPGTEDSAHVLFDGVRVIDHARVANERMLTLFTGRVLTDAGIDRVHVVIEGMEGFGMPVGREVFQTVFWTGRFFERASAASYPVERVMRRAVKLHLCGASTAKDANVRMALLDRFGGQSLAIGRKQTPGPLYGLKADEWSALALAVTWWDSRLGNNIRD